MHSHQPSLGYWTLGAQFLRLAEQTCAEIVAASNPHVVVSDAVISPSEHAQAVQWSDHSVGTAVLFNFFHGIELVLKGFLAAKGLQKQHHRLTDLLEAFEEAFPDTELGVELWQALPAPCTCSPIARFLDSNGIVIDDWFQALKYPESTKGHQYSHTDLKYGGVTTVPFWNDVREFAVEIRRKAIALSRAQGYA